MSARLSVHALLSLPSLPFSLSLLLHFSVSLCLCIFILVYMCILIFMYFSHSLSFSLFSLTLFSFPTQALLTSSKPTPSSRADSSSGLLQCTQHRQPGSKPLVDVKNPRESQPGIVFVLVLSCSTRHMYQLKASAERTVSSSHKHAHVCMASPKTSMLISKVMCACVYVINDLVRIISLPIFGQLDNEKEAQTLMLLLNPRPFRRTTHSVDAMVW